MTTAQDFATGFCSALNNLLPGWTVSLDEVNRPDGAKVRFLDRHAVPNDRHTDVEFIVDGSTSFHDCVVGFGTSGSEVARTAAQIWVSTTGRAVLELLYSRRGEFADHLHATDPAGFPGWHAIIGPTLGYGDDVATAEQLREWLIEQMTQGLLPGLARVIGADLAQHAPHSLKLFLGGDSVAEVRLDGDVHEEASRWLGGLDWPRLDPFPIVRTYVILVHPEPPPGRSERRDGRGRRRRWWGTTAR